MTDRAYNLRSRLRSMLVAGATAMLGACASYGPPPIHGASLRIATAHQAPYGTYLIDGAGRALYILEGERGSYGMSRCVADCLHVWPAVRGFARPLAGPGVDPMALATVPLHGQRHVTYAGWPLYYYVGDRRPGDTTGQHVRDQWGTWHLLAPSGQPIRPMRY